MASVPANPKIYHITRCHNLEGIVASGVLWSDAKRIELGIETELIGMRSIKEARLGKPVKCYPDTKVGEYVPFYFCHRSVMLYILYKGNHPELSYRGGQEPIVHLVSDLHAAVTWANSDGRKWAFTDCNARAEYAGFFKRLADLDKLNWQAVGATDFRDPVIQDRKQAEFLVYESFPWQLVERIGVLSRSIETEANSILTRSAHKPTVSIERSWYY